MEINTSLFKKTHLKMSSAKWHLFLLGLNVLRHVYTTVSYQCSSTMQFLSHIYNDYLCCGMSELSFEISIKICYSTVIFLLIFIPN